ncbi:hypothetical protein M514_05998 [Trichuris suis]|uniref:SCP domain-containing protein n=1 Tax=Trichuris suis TaxID=68888 RepID=A0A085MW33_9BILA|nr:hypothetical protein M513_05998 [Trichuris suis]KFD61429.1 hypothetical protein M514_05998 [Trichuris suis]
MHFAFFVLLLLDVTSSFGRKGNPIELTDNDRQQFLVRLNKFRSNHDSSNMECLTEWNSKMEKKATIAAAQSCSTTYADDSYGSAVVYANKLLKSVAEYVKEIEELKHVYDVDNNVCNNPIEESTCNTYKQFAWWKGGQFACAVSACIDSSSATPTTVVACLFEHKADKSVRPYSNFGQACSFCSSGFTCTNKLCCKSSHTQGCASKPTNLVAVRKLAMIPLMATVLTTDAEEANKLLSRGYVDMGVFGYVSDVEDPKCPQLKKLVEMVTPRNQTNRIYVVDELQMAAYGRKGFQIKSVIGYAVEKEGLCSSDSHAYHFETSPNGNYFTSSDVEAELIISKHGPYAAYKYLSKQFALWKSG